MLIYVILMYALFASTFTFGKAILAFTTPIFSVAIRLIVAGILLLVYQFFSDRSRLGIRKQDWLLYLKLMIFMGYIAFAAEYWALDYMSSSKACLIFNLAPFASAILAYIFLNDIITKKQFFALIGGFVSFLPILMQQQVQEHVGKIELFGFLSLPELALFAAMTAGSYGWIVLKEAVLKGYTIPVANGIAMLGGGIMALVHSFVQEGLPVIQNGNPPLWASLLLRWFGISHVGLFFFMWYTILLLLASNIIGYNMYSWLLRYYSVTFISFAGFITPLFAALFGWLLLGETISWQFFATIAGVFVSLYIFYQDEINR
jgi:drug/metabolite transporter (DMT)-like permease